MTVKKKLRSVVTSVLAVGASLILGFLSFSGMFALWPILSLALVAFALSLFDLEINYKNIESVEKKFKKNYLEQKIAEQFLLELVLLVEQRKISPREAPDFINDYLCELHLNNMDEEDKFQKKRLRDMEKWFASQLFPKEDKWFNHRSMIITSIKNASNLPKNTYIFSEKEKTVTWINKQGDMLSPTQEQLAELPTLYELKLQRWLQPYQEAQKEKLQEQKQTFRLFKAGSSIAALFMTFGTTYLLSDGFANIPLLASLSATTLPYIILPMAIVAGLAYGLLTYNAFTDMANDKILSKRYDRLREDIRRRAWHRAPMAFLTIGLFLLTGILTLCTVGTWWTIIKQTRPLFSWMSKVPSFLIMIMGVTLAWSTGGFNLGNAFTTLNELEADTSKEEIQEEAPIEEVENNWQRINPFRIFIKLTFTPIRILFFLMHLISVSVSYNRMPSLSEIVSTILNFISEGFEDFHYIFGKKHHKHKHKHDLKMVLTERLGPGGGEHNHENDIPTRALKTIFTPLYWLAALWHVKTADKNASMSFKEALEYQKGLKPKHPIIHLNSSPSPSRDWEKQHALYLLEKRKDKLGLFSEKKEAKLNELKATLYMLDFTNRATLKQTFKTETRKNRDHTNTHTPTFLPTNTPTALFIKELPNRIIGHAPRNDKFSTLHALRLFQKNCGSKPEKLITTSEMCLFCK